MRAARGRGSISSTRSRAARSSDTAPANPEPTSHSTPPTTDEPAPYGTAAALASAHQSRRSTTSASSRGRATTSGGCSIRPSNARTTSRYDLPYVWLARDSTSEEQISANADGGVNRGDGKSHDANVGAGRGETSDDEPSRAATAAPKPET